MATVVLNQSNKDDIIRMANALFEKQIREAKSPLPDSWGITIYQRVVEEQFGEQMKSVPAEFFPVFGVVAIRVRKDQNSTGENYQFELPTKKLFPFKLPSNPLADNTYHASASVQNSFELKFVDEWADLREAISNRHAAITAAEEARKNFTGGVMKVLDAHKSLAPALRAWPPLWDLLPNAMKEKHKQIVERSKPADKQVIDADLDSLTGVVVRAKIMKGE